MGNVIIIAVLVVIAVIAIKSYTKKLSSGCCGAQADTEKKVRVSDKNLSHYPYHVKISIQGMTCKHCKARVENALNAEEGVWAAVDLKANSADVHTKQPVPESDFRKIIERAGYYVTDIKDAG